LKLCDARLDDIAKRIDQIEVLGVEAAQELGSIQQELENLKVWS
jgi:F0F1-type ATP synthase membrane subunit b/b'